MRTVRVWFDRPPVVVTDERGERTEGRFADLADDRSASFASDGTQPRKLRDVQLPVRAVLAWVRYDGAWRMVYVEASEDTARREAVAEQRDRDRAAASAAARYTEACLP